MIKEKINVAIITASDKGYKGERIDTSGAKIKSMCIDKNMNVLEYIVLPDEKDILSKKMLEFSENKKINLIITTGGTGFSKRDVTPEATLEILEKNAFGISEAMRIFSLKYSKNSMLSRGVSGIVNDTLIVNLPGSEKAVSECLEYIIDTLEHGIGIMLGSISECARK